jgi:hypothetical protein
MEREEHSKRITVVRWIWLFIFVFAAAAFGSSWPHSHKLSSALYAVGFLAIGVRGFIRPIGSERPSPSKSGTLHFGTLFLGLLGPVLVLAGAWLQ